MAVGFASAQTTPAASAPQVPTLTDVPAGHWAKDAIDKIVAKGIILGYPDGTFRGTQNLTRYEAAVIISRLLDQIAAGTVTTTTGSTTTIDPETLTALQNAVQELAADLAALGVRVTDLESNSVSQDDFARLEARVEALGTPTDTTPAPAGDTAALDALNQQISDLSARADDLQSNYDSLRADVDDNASSIAALNDLTVLLNNDILGLQDRVSAVESALPDLVGRADFNALTTRVSGIDTRVTTLESAPKFSFTGSIGGTFGGIGLLSGKTNFDVDRLTRKTFADGAFSIGTDCTNSAASLISGGGVQPSSPAGARQAYAEQCVDTTDNFSGATLSFGIKASNLVTANGALVVSDAAVNFETNFGTNFLQVDNARVNGAFGGQPFSVVYDYQNSAFRFNDYLFNANSDTEPVIKRQGFVLTATGTTLPFSPKLTVVAGVGSTNVTYGVNGTATPDPVLVGPYFGIRAEANPFGIGPIGLNYAQNVGNRSAFGVDYNVKVGPVSVDGLYDLSLSNAKSPYTSLNDYFSKGDSAFYTRAAVDLGIAKIAANYRAIAPAYTNGVAGMSPNDTFFYNYNGVNANGNAYGADIVGYGGALSSNLGPITVAAFGDRYSNYNPSADTTSGVTVTTAGVPVAGQTIATPGSSYRTAYGVALGGKLFGLSVTGFYNRDMSDVGATYAVVDGVASRYSTTQHTDNNFYAYNSTAAYQDTGLVPFAYSSTYGGVLKHDGSAADALIKGLNFTVADQYFYNDSINDFQAYGSYGITLGGLTVTPFARYHSFNVPGNNGTTTVTTADGTATKTYNAVKYGVQVAIPAMTGIIGKPSFAGGFENSITTPGASIAATTGSKTELYGQAALTLNDIGVANTTASIGYGYYQGFGLGSGGATIASSASSGTATFSPTADRIFRSPLGGASDPYTGANLGSNAGSVQGVFGQVNFNGLALNAGYFRYNDFVNSANNSSATAFKVAYTLNF
ncbi:S-layer protein [Deinococcus ruber]|uniref:S-layer protein n=2 Tax=Deinococcus ruber TaxID=1848197 RepID=A0A918F802_9DEIO|nr:S-layer protein [Deinococcus ruber]